MIICQLDQLEIIYITELKPFLNKTPLKMKTSLTKGNLKRLLTTTLILSFLLVIPQHVNSEETDPDKPILIRPFGDSITYGFGFTDYKYCPTYPGSGPWCTPPSVYGGGYRGWLTFITLASLATKEEPPFIFMTEGHQSGGSSLQQWQTATQAHDGYPGFRTDQLITASTYPSFSDVTLVHAGTNDIAQKRTVDSAATNLFTILDNLLANNSRTHVYVAQIIPFAKPVAGCKLYGKPCFDYTIYNDSVTKYNSQIAVKYDSLDAAKKARITVVNMQNLLNGKSGNSPNEDYFAYGVHPNMMGYMKIACTWIKAIKGATNPSSNPCEGIGPKMPPMPPMPSPAEMDQMMKDMGFPPE